MQLGFIFGILGSVLLLIGVFVPLVSFPVWGGISLFQIQQPVAVALLILGAAHLVFCINRVTWGLYVTKIGVLLAIAYGIYRGWDKVNGHGNSFADLLHLSINMHWGTGLLAAGILILMAAAIPRKSRTEPEAEEKAEFPRATEE